MSFDYEYFSTYKAHIRKVRKKMDEEMRQQAMYSLIFLLTCFVEEGLPRREPGEEE